MADDDGEGDGEVETSLGDATALALVTEIAGGRDELEHPSDAESYQRRHRE